MIGPRQEELLKALESGNYPQGKTYLCQNGSYCFFGVAEEVCGLNSKENKDGVIVYKNRTSLVNSNVLEYFKIFEFMAPRFYDLNDQGIPFKEIAKKVRQNPEEYFSESA